MLCGGGVGVNSDTIMRLVAFIVSEKIVSCECFQGDSFQVLI